MLGELGFYALILALCFSLFQVIMGFAAVFHKNTFFLLMTRLSVLGQWFFVFLSFTLLASAFLVNDFSLLYVANNSNTALPWIYRVCALWGAHEGSMLLWVFILSLWTVLLSWFGRSLPLATLARVMVVLGLIALGFYLFILFTSNPFLRFFPFYPATGRDLNPLLQDPGLISHPPILYMGYVGLSVPFAFAIAALWQGQFVPSMARWMRGWTILAWSFLTLGIVLGSWWAYRELGWGGWWFWDPVENASFLPWLVATALIHSLIVAEKRNQFKSWVVLLAICAFSLSLIGTFLVRSGILISVHAFAVDSSRGAFMLQFLLVVIAGSLILYAFRARHLASKNQFNFLSRESFLMANNMLLFVAMLTVLLGTFYPLIVDVLGWGKISVGAPYFNTVFIPIVIPLVFLMAFAPLLYWQHHQRSLIKPLLIIFIFALLLAIILYFVYLHQHALTIIGLFLAFWLMLNTLYHRYRYGLTLKKWGVFAAHLGLSVSIIGIVLAHNYSQERDLRIHVGETAKIGPYVFTLQNIAQKNGPNFIAARAIIALNYHGKLLSYLHPEYRLYQVAKTAISKTDIDINWRRDLYVALGNAFDDDSWSMRIYYKPFVRWIWVGGLLIVLGGLISLFSRKRA